MNIDYLSDPYLLPGELIGICLIMQMTSLPPGLMSILTHTLSNWGTPTTTPFINEFLPVLVQLGNLVCES